MAAQGRSGMRVALGEQREADLRPGAGAGAGGGGEEGFMEEEELDLTG